MTALAEHRLAALAGAGGGAAADVDTLFRILAAAPPAEPPKIVLADDDPQIRMLLALVLKRRGYQCTEAADGGVACEAVARLHPDLLLVDWMMPVLDGCGTVAKIKADPQTRRTPAIMLTGHTAVAAKIAALEAGAQDFINKPFDNKELAARVAAQLCWRDLLGAVGDDSAPPPELAPCGAVPAGLSDRVARADGATAAGSHAEAVSLLLEEAEGADERKQYERATFAYREAAAAATRHGAAALANRLLRLAGLMALFWAGGIPDPAAAAAAYREAARCFGAAGNLSDRP